MTHYIYREIDRLTIFQKIFDGIIYGQHIYMIKSKTIIIGF